MEIPGGLFRGRSVPWHDGKTHSELYFCNDVQHTRKEPVGRTLIDEAAFYSPGSQGCR